MAPGFPDKLQGELPGWVREGLVTEDQADALRTRYPVSEESRREHRIIRVIAWIGAALAAVGIILFVATNWTRIPHAVRIVLLVAVTGALWGPGAWMVRSGRVGFLGHALLFLGGVSYGGTLLQVGNTFHLPAHHSGLVSLWILGVLPLAYVLRNWALHLLAVLLVPIWVMNTFLLDGPIRNVRTGAAAFQGAGLLLVGLGLFHPRPGERGRLPPFRSVTLLGGTLLAFLPAFVLTFFDTGDLEPVQAAEGAVTAGLILLWIAAALALAAAAAWVLRDPSEGWMGLAPHVLGLVLFGAVLVLEPIPLNWTYAAAVIALMPLSILARDELLLDLGILLFVVEVFGRYVEFLVDYRNPWIAFLVGGAVLLALAYGLFVLHRFARQRMRAVPPPRRVAAVRRGGS